VGWRPAAHKICKGPYFLAFKAYSMKTFGCICLAVLAIGATGCWEKSASNGNGPLWQSHFVGVDAIQKGNTATTFQRVWKMPESAELREQSLQKLARAPFEFWKAKLPQGTKDEAALIRPLLDDLVRAESYFEVHGPSDKPETAIAIKLTADRASVWDKNLTGLAAAWKLGKPVALAGGSKGWEVTGSKAAERIQFQKVGDWVVVSFGPSKLQLLPKWTEAIAKGGQPSTATAGKLLEVTADLPGLSPWLPILRDYPLPPMQLSMTGSGPDVKTEMTLKYSSKIPFTFEPWILPTEIIRDPLVSFTVAQGFAPLLKDFKSIQTLALQPLPNQICVWGQGHLFPLTYFTTPVPNASVALNQFALGFPKVIENNRPGHLGEFLWNSNKALIWKEVPFISPRVVAYSNKTEQFVFGEVFPRAPFTNPPPTELFSQFKDRKDVLYYDWEFAKERMPHADQLFQLHDILSNRKNLSPTTPAQKWIVAVSTNLAECITEISLSSPNELKLKRKSQLGFTGFEMVGLARWINSARFPFE
jgi:hypothetical protein